MLTQHESQRKYLLLVALCLFPLSGLSQDQWAALSQQAMAFSAQGRYAEAMTAAQGALTASKNFGMQSLQYGLSLNAVGYLEMVTGDLPSAQPDLEQAMSLVIAAAGPKSVQAATPITNLANLYVQMAQRQSMNPKAATELLAKAEKCARQNLDIGEYNFKGTDIQLASAIRAVAQVLVAESKFDDALQYQKRLLSILQTTMPPDNMNVLQAREELAGIVLGTGDKAEALAQFRAILADSKKSMKASDPFVGTLQDIVNQLSTD